MKVLVFTTGGTIGSYFDGESIDVCADGKNAVIDRYVSEHSGVHFTIKRTLNILSERITAEDFNTLAKALFDADFSEYDGVILTAGSDNLAYIASFVGLLCGDLPVPIMIVAANKILTAPDSNGYANFCAAAELIGQGVRGVFVPYRNDDGVIYVHSATDIRQADLSEDFYSFHGAYATYENGVLNENRTYIAQTIPAVFGKDRLPTIGDDVLMLHPYPLLDYSAIRIDGKKAVLHTLYHSGTAAPFCVDVFSEAPVFLASLRSGRPLYSSTAALIQGGAIPLYDISPECAYMKLLLACAQDQMSVREFMEKSLPFDGLPAENDDIYGGDDGLSASLS